MSVSILNTIIVDDEKHAVESLHILLKDFYEINVIGEFTSSVEAFKFISENSTDLVFLDIKMPELSGLAFAEKVIDLKLDTSIIFTTAYDNFILDALRKNAVDYLLKPVSETDIKDGIERLKKRTKSQAIVDLQKLISANHRNKLRFNTRNGFISIYEDEILYIKADGVYSDIALISEKIVTISQNLGKIRDLLKLPELKKIHRSVIVNCRYIFEVHKGKKECILYSNGQNYKLPVSADGIQEIESFLKN